MRIDPTILLETLNDDEFNRIKISFLEKQIVLSKTKHNKLVETLTDILCSHDVIEKMNRQEFGQLILSYFYKEWSDKVYIVKYMEWLKSLITDNLGRCHTIGRAKQYSDYLDKIIAQVKDANKKKIEETDDDKTETIEYLMDFAVIVMRLMQSFQDVSDNENQIDDLSDYITVETYSAVPYAQFKRSKDGIIIKADQQSEEKWFKWFLTQIVIIRLMQDNEELFQRAIE